MIDEIINNFQGPEKSNFKISQLIEVGLFENDLPKLINVHIKAPGRYIRPNLNIFHKIPFSFNALLS